MAVHKVLPSRLFATLLLYLLSFNVCLSFLGGGFQFIGEAGNDMRWGFVSHQVGKRCI